MSKWFSVSRHDGSRAAGTSIYFLLEAPNFVAWHRHLSEEAFYWHVGGPLRVSTHLGREDSSALICKISSCVIQKWRLG